MKQIGILLFPLFCISTAIQCPDSSQWKFRQSGFCNVTDKWYFCLYDENLMQYVEFCRHKPDLQRPGYKFIVRGNLDGLQCNKSRYQPIKFWTNGSSECIIKKSSCREEGLIIHSEGNSTSDRTCRCDYTNGYSFVNRPKDKCFCDPILEDCSCYKKPCRKYQVLTPDYDCIRIADWTGIFTCKIIKKKKTEVESTKQRKHHSELPCPAIMRYTLEKIIVTTIVIPLILFIGIPIYKLVAMIQRTSHHDYNDKIPEKTRDAYLKHIANWHNDDKKFTVTRATKEIERKLTCCNCVLVVGRSGNGKSAILRHLALKLLNKEGYDIVPFVFDPTTILQYHNPERKQIFVIDDFCGKVVINAHNVEMWLLNIDNILNLITNNQEHTERAPGKGKVKLLFATPGDVFGDTLFKSIDCLSKYKFHLSDLPLLEEEKKEMFKRYLPKKHNFNPNQFIGTMQGNADTFPLKCKYSEGKTANQMLQLFINPYEVIRLDILALQQTNKNQMCLIALCVLLEYIPEDIFCKTNTPEKNKLLIDIVCSEFDIDLRKETTRLKLQAELQRLENSYLVKSGDSYHLEHNEIYDIAAVVLGGLMKKVFIRFAPSSFIAERYSFISNNTKERENCISIHDENTEKEYFDRLMNDLEYKITYSTFHNSQLMNESYRGKFCAYCRRRKQKFIELLNRLPKRGLELYANQNDTKTAISEKNIYEYQDYIKFTKQYHFSSHNMKIPLIESAWEGKEDIVELLIEMERNINEVDKFGRSALFVSCQRGMTNVAVLLLTKGADYSLCDDNEASPLHSACKGGYYAIVEALLKKGADASARDKKGYSPLLAASESGHTTIVDLLIKNEARLEDCDTKGFTPLIAACFMGKFNVANKLLKCNANVKTVDNDGRSALLIACQNGGTKIVDLLLKNNADVSQCDWHCHSPLFIACSLGDKDIVELLLKYKADISQCDEDGRSPLFIACEKGHNAVLEILLPKCQVEIVEKADNKGRSPLFVACGGGFLEIVKKLVSKGSKIDKRNSWQMTPLFVACREGNPKVVRYLIEKDADMNAADHNGQTPLSVACDYGYADVVTILKKYNADVKHTDNDHKTPLELAEIRGHTKIVDILIGRH